MVRNNTDNNKRRCQTCMGLYVHIVFSRRKYTVLLHHNTNFAVVKNFLNE